MKRDNGRKRAMPALALVSLLCLGAACASSPPPGPGPVVLDEAPPDDALEQARDVADQLGQSVVAALFRELESGDPTRAIRVCAVEAQRLSAEYSTGDLAVRRISRRFRNPADEPDAYEYQRLTELQELRDEGRMPPESAQVVMQNGNKSLRYLKPILVKQPCLMCHGSVSDIRDDTLDAIHAQYPGDRAIGYRVDDLRGAISVTVQL